MQHMRGIIPLLFNCWADPVAHLLLLKHYMVEACSLYEYTGCHRQKCVYYDHYACKR